MPVIGKSYKLHFNDGPFGPGYRSIMVMSCGKKWITVIYIPRLKVGKVRVSQWYMHSPRRIQASQYKSAFAIKRKIKKFHRLGLVGSRKSLHEFANKMLRVH